MAHLQTYDISNLAQIEDPTSGEEQDKFPAISTELQAILQRIVDDVVSRLGCVGAMVAPLEMDNSLPVRAYSVDFSPTLLRTLETKLNLSFLGPNSVAYLDDDRFKDNLSVRAVKGEGERPGVIISDQLHDLFRPVVNKPLSQLAQRLTGIKQVIAVPFFAGDQVVGNLFAASKTEFTERDIDFLIAFGNQAATAIQTQRYLTQTQALERIILSLQSNITDETQVLEIIVKTVVDKLGYIGAMVATLEADNSLPVRAYAFGFDSNLIDWLQNKIGLTPLDPRVAVYLEDERFQDNLSVQAVKGLNGRPRNLIVSNRLYDLFRPVVNRPLSELAQRLTGIKQVMAVPFFLEKEVVGNLLVASQRPEFQEWEREILVTFGQQAAVGLYNARLYRKAEERRHIAQMFARMAFSATAYIHALRNQIGATRTYLQLVEMREQLPPAKQASLDKMAANAIDHLDEAVDVLDNLHEPWQQRPDIPTDVNDCLTLAGGKIFAGVSLRAEQTEVETEEGITIYASLSEDLPLIQTSPDMLTEAFRVLIKNAVEAIEKVEDSHRLWLETSFQPETGIKVVVRDDGVGIEPQDVEKLFELGWSTKAGQGMGFGLFWTRDYIEGLGGSITVDRRWQEGAAFRVTLPVPTDES